ncbi:hypothetical protein TNCV_1153241 [Trichonephila clavipes]|nr:hypothetical protein TNCV_1153241 [Trichonephila clavipes]
MQASKRALQVPNVTLWYVHTYCTCCVNGGTVSGGCGCCWSCHPMIFNTCSIGDRSVGHVALKQRSEGERYPVGKLPLECFS